APRVRDDQLTSPVAVQITQVDTGLEAYPPQGLCLKVNPRLAVESKACGCRNETNLSADDSKRPADEVAWEFPIGPCIFLRLPETHLPSLLVADHHIQIAVVVQVNEPHAVVGAVLRVAQRHAAEEVLRQPLAAVAEGQELHPLAVLL